MNRMIYILGIGDWISNAVNGLTDKISGALSHWWFSIVYEISTGICSIVEILDKMFSVMSGSTYVTYDGSKDFLINVFFNNTIIRNIYWAMALIGIAFCFVFTAVAVAKKSVDIYDKMRQSMGSILTGLFKSIILIVSMNLIMTVALYGTNILLTQVTYAIQNAESLNKKASIEYTNEDYAAMARVLDTIGNYSLNPSYDSRYNINSCFNEIRDDLYLLQTNGVFDFQYDTIQDGVSWQSALQAIANAADLTQDLDLDVRNDGVTTAIEAVISELNSNAGFQPLKEYHRQYQLQTGEYLTLDRTIFLICTFDAAKNDSLNTTTTGTETTQTNAANSSDQNADGTKTDPDNKDSGKKKKTTGASLTDSLRSAYYYGQKSIYTFTSVDNDFDITKINYLLMIFLCYIIGKNLLIMILNCVARIFNMLVLYLVSPMVIATIPLDEGGKMKQWSTAFIVQCFGVFGNIITMRLLLVLTPVIMGDSLVLFDNKYLNWIGKIILIIGATEAAKRTSGIITGILSDQAGMQSINAGDMSDKAKFYSGKMYGAATGVAGLGLGAAKGLAGGAVRGVMGAADYGKQALMGYLAQRAADDEEEWWDNLPSSSAQTGGRDAGPGGNMGAAPPAWGMPGQGAAPSAWGMPGQGAASSAWGMPGQGAASPAGAAADSAAAAQPGAGNLPGSAASGVGARPDGGAGGSQAGAGSSQGQAGGAARPRSNSAAAGSLPPNAAGQGMASGAGAGSESTRSRSKSVGAAAKEGSNGSAEQSGASGELPSNARAQAESSEGASDDFGPVGSINDVDDDDGASEAGDLPDSARESSGGESDDFASAGSINDVDDGDDSLSESSRASFGSTGSDGFALAGSINDVDDGDDSLSESSRASFGSTGSDGFAPAGSINDVDDGRDSSGSGSSGQTRSRSGSVQGQNGLSEQAERPRSQTVPNRAVPPGRNER